MRHDRHERTLRLERLAELKIGLRKGLPGRPRSKNTPPTHHDVKTKSRILELERLLEEAHP